MDWDVIVLDDSPLAQYLSGFFPFSQILITELRPDQDLAPEQPVESCSPALILQDENECPVGSPTSEFDYGRMSGTPEDNHTNHAHRQIALLSIVLIALVAIVFFYSPFYGSTAVCL